MRSSRPRSDRLPKKWAELYQLSYFLRRGSRDSNPGRRLCGTFALETRAAHALRSVPSKYTMIVESPSISAPDGAELR